MVPTTILPVPHHPDVDKVHVRPDIRLVSYSREIGSSSGPGNHGAGQIAVVRRVTWVGFVVNLLLTGFKLVAGLVGNSAAVVADAVHSLSDCVTDVAVLVGIRYWSRPPDETHPYGHKRIETLVTAFIGVMLAAAAFGLGWDAIKGLTAERDDPPTVLALIAALTSIVLKEALYHYTRIAGTRVRSSALAANAWHHRSDALSSIPASVAVGLALYDPTLAFVDHVGELLVAMLVLVAAWKISAPALDQLVDRGASAADTAVIRCLAEAVPGVREVHELRTRFAGVGILVDVHVLVTGSLTVCEGHRIADEVKRSLVADGPNVEDAVIHIEPFEEASHGPPEPPDLC
ncbi:MAG TPA: cation diffusion facilitator family transporter [Polyangia bacterium]|nr:cation diffusion facilitator family transporter [Polyangia bacterium]